MEGALVRPVFGAGDKTFADGIGADVRPFFGEVFALADLGVPALALPKGTGVGKRKGKGHFGFPVFQPAMEIGDGRVPRKAEKVDVVRHDHVAGNAPVLCVVPSSQEAIPGGGMGEDALSMIGADGDEQKDGLIVGAFENGVSGRAAAGGKRGMGREDVG